MLTQHTLLEDLTAEIAIGNFYHHLDSNLKDRIIYKIIKISEGTAIAETYDVNGFHIEPPLNKNFKIQDDSKLIISLECFSQDKRAKFFKIKRLSYRTFF